MTVLAVSLVIAIVVQHVLYARERSVLLDRIQAPEKAPFSPPAKVKVDEDEIEEARQHLELAMMPDA